MIQVFTYQLNISLITLTTRKEILPVTDRGFQTKRNKLLHDSLIRKTLLHVQMQRHKHFKRTDIDYEEVVELGA